MIYTEIEHLTKEQTAALREELETIPSRLIALRTATHTEDSKKRERELNDEIKALVARQREICREVSRIEEEAFQKVLAIEYGVEGNPKFGQAYDIAWSRGHSGGFSEVENYFSELVELIK